LVFGAAVASLPAYASANQCAIPPNRNVAYTKEFHAAASYFSHKSQEFRGRGEAKVPIGEMPIAPVFKGSHDLAKAGTTKTARTEQEAISFVQRELTRESVALTAECLYAINCGGAGSGTAEGELTRLDAIGRVCSQVFGSPLSSPATDAPVLPTPSLLYVDPLTPQPVRIALYNTNRRTSMPLRAPAADAKGLVTFAGVEGGWAWQKFWPFTGPITIPRDASTAVLLRAQPRPGARQWLETTKVRFEYEGGGGGVDVNFVVAREPAKPLREGCDYLVNNDHCGRCTFTVPGGTKIAAGDDPVGPFSCPEMKSGRIIVELKGEMQLKRTCPTHHCGQMLGKAVISAPGMEKPKDLGFGHRLTEGGLKAFAGRTEVNANARGTVTITLNHVADYSYPKEREPEVRLGFELADSVLVIRHEDQQTTR
jgi:hypothetical protein